MHIWTAVRQLRGAFCVLGELCLWQQALVSLLPLHPHGLSVSHGLAHMALLMPLALLGDIPALW